MIQADILSGFLCLPQRRFKQIVLVIIPNFEAAVQQSAGIARVWIQTPECMVDVIVNHIVTQQGHPLLVLAAVHVTAPFADQQGSDVLIVDVCPRVIPVIIQQFLGGKVLVKPRLVVYRRTVVMRRIHNLAVAVCGTEVDRIILYTT